jgi:hypothetical protein
MHLYVKGCGNVPHGLFHSAGVTLGSERDTSAFRDLMYCTSGRAILHLFSSPPSPCTINVPPNLHGVNNCFWAFKNKELAYFKASLDN